MTHIPRITQEDTAGIIITPTESVHVTKFGERRPQVPATRLSQGRQRRDACSRLVLSTMCVTLSVKLDRERSGRLRGCLSSAWRRGTVTVSSENDP